MDADVYNNSMASRLQQFATRNQKSGIEPTPGKRFVSQKAGASRRARHEPTLLDTDVESIGNATTLSFGDFEEDPGEDEAGVEAQYMNTRANQDVPPSRGELHHYAISSTPPRRWPAGVQARSKMSTKSDHRAKASDHNAFVSSHDREPERAARLDDISSVPDSSWGPASLRDPSPSPQGQDPDETPRRIKTGEMDSVSALGEFKQHINRTRAPPQWNTPPSLPPPPSKMQPSHKPAGGLQGSSSAPDAALLDYSPTTLGGMSYEQLAGEAFETDPARAAVDAEAGDSTTVLERVRSIAMSDANGDDDDATKHAQLAALFAQLPLEQYEAAGDMILEQFGAVFGRFQEIRRRKRAVAAEFERRVADRERTVRERHEALDRSASWLKRQGEDVIRGGPVEK